MSEFSFAHDVETVNTSREGRPGCMSFEFFADFLILFFRVGGRGARSRCRILPLSKH